MENISEVWKLIEEYPEYEISSIGRIRNKKGAILKYFNSSGYNKIKLINSITKKRKQFAIHRLVALAFIPQCLGKTQVNHKNKIRNDNIYTNLEWVTPSENMLHAYKGKVSRNGVGNVSINFVLDIYNNNKNIPTHEFKQLLLKEPFKIF